MGDKPLMSKDLSEESARCSAAQLHAEPWQRRADIHDGPCARSDTHALTSCCIRQTYAAHDVKANGLNGAHCLKSFFDDQESFMRRVAFLFCLGFSQVLWAQGPVKNLIIVVGDGMGYEQVKATGMYFNGREGSLNFESFPHKGDMSTASASDKITDSAAAATAMATGVKTINGYVGRDARARDVPNITEIAKLGGKSTGLLTSVAVSHATPAGFGAHEDFREKKNGIVDSLALDICLPKLA
jgi:hypothetical protein